MPLIDDLHATVPETELKRRKVLGVLTGAAFVAAGGGTVITTIRYLRPNVLFEPPSKVTIGPVAEVAAGTLLVVPEHKLYVARVAAGLFAMSSVCTHLGCMTRYDAAKNVITCPCHGSSFDPDGAVTGGPAPSPLIRKKTWLESGQIIVDLRQDADPDFVLEV